MKPPRVFYGWWIVAAGMGITWLASILFVYGFSAFFIPWRVTFGWSRAVLGGVVGMSRLEGGVIAPVAGWLVDKHGPRRIMLLGLSMMGIGFLTLSLVNSLLMLYLVFLGLLAAGSSFGTYLPVQVAVANWFVRRRGLAVGLLMTGSGLGGSFVFLFAMVIESFGWRTGAILAGLSTFAVGFPLTWAIRHRPEEMGLLPDGDLANGVSGMTRGSGEEETMSQVNRTGGPLAPSGVERVAEVSQDLKPRRFWMRDVRPEIDLTAWQALRTPAFWIMATTFAIWAAVPGITTVHLAPFLAEEMGLEYVVAIGALSFFAFASVVGRLGFGFFADYVNIRLLMSGLMVMQGIGIFLFSQVQTLGQVVFCLIIFAVPLGGTIAMRAVLQGYFFGRKAFGTIGGLLQFVDLPASVLAPIWVGWLADVMPGGYRLGFQIIASSLFVAAGCILLARRPRAPLPAGTSPFHIPARRH